MRCFFSAAFFAASLMLPMLFGCHGSELRVGTGRQFNDGGGSFSSSSKCSSSSGRFDVEDSSSIWVELAFQLAPHSVRIIRVSDESAESAGACLDGAAPRVESKQGSERVDPPVGSAVAPVAPTVAPPVVSQFAPKFDCEDAVARLTLAVDALQRTVDGKQVSVSGFLGDLEKKVQELESGAISWDAAVNTAGGGGVLVAILAGAVLLIKRRRKLLAGLLESGGDDEDPDCSDHSRRSNHSNRSDDERDDSSKSVRKI